VALLLNIGPGVLLDFGSPAIASFSANGAYDKDSVNPCSAFA
jgi:hypothetical protein